MGCGHLLLRRENAVQANSYDFGQDRSKSFSCPLGQVHCINRYCMSKLSAASLAARVSALGRGSGASPARSEQFLSRRHATFRIRCCRAFSRAHSRFTGNPPIQCRLQRVSLWGHQSGCPQQRLRTSGFQPAGKKHFARACQYNRLAVRLRITLKPVLDCEVHQPIVPHVHAERRRGREVLFRTSRSRSRRHFLCGEPGSGTVEIRNCLFDFAAAIGT
jgi:hypothetical protein